MTYTIEQLREALEDCNIPLVIGDAARDHLKHMEGMTPHAYTGDFKVMIFDGQDWKQSKDMTAMLSTFINPGWLEQFLIWKATRSEGMTGERTEWTQGARYVQEIRAFCGPRDPDKQTALMLAAANWIEKAMVEAKPEGEKDEVTIDKLVVGRIYKSATHGDVEYKGTDTYMGETSLHFRSITYNTDCYWLPSTLPYHFRQPDESRPAIPEGYALVPIEPTKEMALKGARAGAALLSPDDARDVWKSMIAAAKEKGDEHDFFCKQKGYDQVES